MQPAVDHERKESKQTPREWAAYPLALIAGYNVFETAVRKACYKNIASQGVFNDLQTERKKNYQSLFKTAESDTHSITDAVMKLEDKYRLDVRARFDQHGIHGLEDYWKTLKRNQKQDALMLAATVSGVVLGALLTISDHSWVHQLTGNQKNAQDKGAERS